MKENIAGWTEEALARLPGCAVGGFSGYAGVVTVPEGYWAVIAVPFFTPSAAQRALNDLVGRLGEN